MMTEHFILLKKFFFAAVVIFLVFVLTGAFSGPGAEDKGTVAFTSQKSKSDANQPPADANEPSQKAEKPSKKKVPRPLHKHRAFGEREDERLKLVARHIQGEGITDPNVVGALRTVPRHSFVRKSDLRAAYIDRPLYIGEGQTISQPYIVGYMTKALELDLGCRVLEIGTGSGYQAAVCAEIAGDVYSIEIIEALAESAEKRLEELGYRNVFVKAGDGYFGWEQKGPFDAIIVTCAAGFIPPPLIEQLKPGGRLIIPLGSPFGAQTLVLLTKYDKGKVRSRRLLPVRFVPMTGRMEE